MVSNALVLTEWINPGDITFLIIRQSMIYQIDNELFFSGKLMIIYLTIMIYHKFATIYIYIIDIIDIL